jgi:hypothetical protein
VSGAASIADQPRINRDPDCVNHRMLLLYLTLFTAENRQNNKHGYIVYRHGVSDGLFRRVEHRVRTNRGFHRHVLYSKLNWSGVLDFELYCSDSSLLLAITIEHSFQTNPNISLKKQQIIILISNDLSSYNSRLSYNKCLSQSPINCDAEFHNRGCWNIPALS